MAENWCDFIEEVLLAENNLDMLQWCDLSEFAWSFQASCIFLIFLT